jgi:hypothetical protein
MLPKRASASGFPANRTPPTPKLNHLLAALPRDEYDRVVRALELNPLKLKTILHRPGERVRHVYFPGGGFCSLLTVLQDGAMVEVATIGRKGMIGIFAVLDNNPATSLSMVQGETDVSFRMAPLSAPAQRVCDWCRMELAPGTRPPTHAPGVTSCARWTRNGTKKGGGHEGEAQDGPR